MKKALSIFLSLLLLASSSGIAYAQHFCGGMQIHSEVTLAVQNLSCQMDGSTGTSCSDGVALEESPCCQNHITKIQTDDNFAKASFEINLLPVFVAPFVSTFVLNEVEIASVQNIFFAEYNPPPLPKDLNILYQTFLI